MKDKKISIDDLKIGQKVKFKNSSGKAIVNEWIDFSEKTGFVTSVSRDQVNIKLDDKIEPLDEWDNELIFFDEEVDELLEQIEIIEDKKLTNEEIINWLNDFIFRWDKAMQSEDFADEAFLQSEYDQFLMNNNLPEMSADELIVLINKIDKVKSTEGLTINNFNTGERYESEIKDIYFSESGVIIMETSYDKIPINYEVINKLLNNEEATIDSFSIRINNKEDVSIEKTAFNNANKFVEEYRDYLIGKQMTDGKGDKFKIIDVSKIKDESAIRLIFENNDEYNTLVDYIDFQNLIDGEEIVSIPLGRNISLLIQDENKDLEIEDSKIEEKINQSDYKYYVVNPKTNKILTGWEYKEDADDNAKEQMDYGKKDIAVFSKKTVKNLGIDVDNNNSWLDNKDNYSIIKEALDFGVTEGDYDQAASDNYLSVYETSGKYLSVIKARLIYYLSHAEKHFKQAVLDSQFEKANRFLDTKAKISEELLKIIKKDI